MRKWLNTLAGLNILKTSSLRNLLIMSVLLVTVIPVFNWYFVYPSFTELLINTAEENALRAGTHLASQIAEDSEPLKKENLDEPFLNSINKIITDFQLMKLKIFSATGQIIYSTDDKEIGKDNNHDYFHNIVAKGNPYTKFVRKDSETLENQIVTMDVVETYVPLMNGKTFLGAFEIYYDITAAKAKVDGILSSSFFIMIFVASWLFLGFLILLFRENRAVVQRNDTQAQLQQAHAELEQKVTERTDELAKKNTALKSLIKKRKRMLKALRENHAVLRRTFDQSPIGAAIVDMDNRFIRVNDQLCRILGFSEQDIKSLPFPNIVHPKDRKAFQMELERLLSNGTDQYQTVKRILSNNDHVAWGRLSVAVVKNTKGRPLHIVPMLEDVTDQKRSSTALRENEELFHTLTNLVPIGIIMTDSMGRCLYVNESWCKISGMTPEQAEGDGWIESIDPQDREQVAAQWSKCSDLEDWFTLTYRLCNPAGEVTSVEARTIQLHSETGEATGFMGTVSPNISR